MFSVPLTGTPAWIAVVLGLGGVFIALSQMSRRSALRVVFLTVALGAVATGGALGLREEATAIAIGGHFFLGGFVLVCVSAAVLLRQLTMAERTLMRTLSDGDAAEIECDRLTAANTELQTRLDRTLAQLRHAGSAGAGAFAGSGLTELQTRVALAEREARVATSLGDEIHDAVAVLDPETLRITSFNAGLCRLTGRSKAELVGTHIEHLVDGNSEILGSFDLDQAAHTGASVIVPLRRPNGAALSAEVHVGRAGTGAEARVVAVLRDVSHEVQLSTEIRGLRELVATLEEEAAQHECAVEAPPCSSSQTQPIESLVVRAETRQSFEGLVEREAAWVAQTLPQEDDVPHQRSVEAVAHDLRVPLTSIRSFSEILLEHDDVADEERAEFLEIIRSESDRLTRMVNDLLDMRRIKSGLDSLELADVDLRDLVRDGMNSLDGLARSRGVTFEGNWARMRRTVRGDRDRLHRMVANLLSNAIKFSPENGVVEVILRDGSEEHGVLFGVRDHGPGIADAEQEIVFERFSRGATGSENVSGSGLGLSICREIVEAHGARIWPESRPQSGATLWVEFPPPERVGESAVDDRIADAAGV